MSKLTKAQKRILRSVADGKVCMHFDVWGGYWWTEDGMRSERSMPSPLRVLIDLGLVKREERIRVYSGRHKQEYSITEAAGEYLK